MGQSGRPVGRTGVAPAQRLERAVTDAARAHWQPARIHVGSGGAVRSVLVFSLSLQTYRLTLSCDRNVRVGYRLIGGSIGQGLEYDAYAFKSTGAGSGTCTVTSKFQGTHVHANLLVTVN
jgi:hypothetical protein